jgi:hypothetical protein
LKYVREESQRIYKGKPIKITADFSTETLKPRKERSEVFQAQKEKISVLCYSSQQSYHSKLMEE